jgi:hypothetical protein
MYNGTYKINNKRRSELSCKILELNIGSTDSRTHKVGKNLNNPGSSNCGAIRTAICHDSPGTVRFRVAMHKIIQSDYGKAKAEMSDFNIEAVSVFSSVP